MAIDLDLLQSWFSDEDIAQEYIDNSIIKIDFILPDPKVQLKESELEYLRQISFYFQILCDCILQEFIDSRVDLIETEHLLDKANLKEALKDVLQGSVPCEDPKIMEFSKIHLEDYFKSMIQDIEAMSHDLSFKIKAQILYTPKQKELKSIAFSKILNKIEQEF